MRKILIELLMEATRRVSSSCSLMTRDSKKVALVIEKTNYSETAIRSMFLPDSVVNGAKIKQLQLVLGVAIGSSQL